MGRLKKGPDATKRKFISTDGNHKKKSKRYAGGLRSTMPHQEGSFYIYSDTRIDSGGITLRGMRGEEKLKIAKGGRETAGLGNLILQSSELIKLDFG